MTGIGKGTRSAVMACLAAAALLSGCGDGEKRGAEGLGFDLVFYSDRTGMGDLYLLPGEGFGTGSFRPGKLLGTGAPDFNPRWVPRGPGLVFVTEIEDPPALYALAPEAEGMAVRLGTNPATDEPPAFTPDGTRMVYAAPSAQGIDLFSSTLQGEDVVQITTDGVRKLQPHISPDGERIAFAVGEDGGQDLAVVGMDGTGWGLLTDDGHNDGHPFWVPDGTGLVFDSNRTGVGTDIFHLDLERNAMRNLTNHPGIDLVATVSPDGEWVAFGSSRSGNWDLYLVPFAGGTARRITATATFEGDPRWVPAGIFILPEPEPEPERPGQH